MNRRCAAGGWPETALRRLVAGLGQGAGQSVGGDGCRVILDQHILVERAGEHILDAIDLAPSAWRTASTW